MTSAPSGHLVVQCDHYDKANKVKHGDHIVFLIDHTHVGDTCASASEARRPESCSSPPPQWPWVSSHCGDSNGHRE
eukprot:1241339-Lingulodinium_polyedra.AAC.1